MPASFQTIQLIALVTYSFEPALPVLVRLRGEGVEFLTLDPAELEDPADSDAWLPLEACNEADYADLREVVQALGGDPAIVLAQFPNCDEY